MIAEYIASVLARSGFEPIQAGSLAEARHALQNRRFDLWLCDRHLPDGDSSTLLTERHPQNRHHGTPAIVLTAELDADARRALLAAGFDDALAKPCTPDVLLAAIDRVTAKRPTDTACATTDCGNESESTTVLDDTSALPVCGGDPATLAAMRRLFAEELPSIGQRLDALWSNGDSSALRDELHRLAASTAWCGAIEVGDRARRLRAAIDGNCDIAVAFDALALALARLMRALDDPATGSNVPV